MRNTLFYGDNLDIMRRSLIPDESVDLIYLDPPFNSARNYNVLFKQAKKDENQAQITAFTDTWQWSKLRYEEFFDEPRNARLFPLMNSLYSILGQSEMMAYLLMMAPRLMELHYKLAPTGSLYLHCDPAASHYLKLTLDCIFGATHYKNEISWKRTSAHSDVKQGRMAYGNIRDVLLYYTKTAKCTFNPQYTPYSQDYLDQFYRYIDEEGRYYRLSDITGPGGAARGNPTYEVMGITRSWRYSREKMEDMIRRGRVVQTSPGAVPREKRYLDEMQGISLQNSWDDIKSIQPHSPERTGYQTQKPVALLERIVKVSSNAGDVILDPFCGCGTAVVAAQKLGRKWIGIDITYIAIDLIITRLNDFNLKRGVDYRVLGDPKDAHSARKLFQESPKQFEIWAVGLVAGVPQPDKSGDRGVDGKVYFMDLEDKLQWAVCQVKGGHLTPTVIRDFAHVIQREKASMGFFICLETPTKGMCREAEEAGFFEAPSGRKIPKLQVRTIKDLLGGKEFDFPKGYSLKSSGKKLTREGEQTELGLD